MYGGIVSYLQQKPFDSLFFYLKEIGLPNFVFLSQTKIISSDNKGEIHRLVSVMKIRLELLCQLLGNSKTVISRQPTTPWDLI